MYSYKVRCDFIACTIHQFHCHFCVRLVFHKVLYLILISGLSFFSLSPFIKQIIEVKESFKLIPPPRYSYQNRFPEREKIVLVCWLVWLVVMFLVLC